MKGESREDRGGKKVAEGKEEGRERVRKTERGGTRKGESGEKREKRGKGKGQRAGNMK